MENKRVFLICEGEYHTLYYLLKHGLNPYKVYFDPLAIKTYIPYITKEDEVLIVLTGMTDFTVKEVYELLKALHDVFGEQSANIKMFSPFKLTGVLYSYYIYSNDLIYSNVKGVVGGKVVPLLDEVTKNNKNNQKSSAKVNKNIVLEPYLAYEGVKVDANEVGIIEAIPKKEEKRKEEAYVNLIKRVDMYKQIT